MAYGFVLGDLICCLYDEYSAIYGDDELAALAADVALNDLFVRFDVHEIGTGDLCLTEDEEDDYDEYDKYFSLGPDFGAQLVAH